MTQAGGLLDAGPLVALLDRSDAHHAEAQRLLSEANTSFLTCEPVIAEACFLVRKISPFAASDLLELGLRGVFEVQSILQKEMTIIHSLLCKYQDRPISLADACLIRLAEIHNEPRILTFDSDFGVYRWGRNRKFEILSGKE